MNQPKIFFVPGKNPKPSPQQHHSLLWRTLVEGVRRAEPDIADDLMQNIDNFKLIAWNYLYYNVSKDINRDIPWIDALINQHAPTDEDIKEATSTHRKFDRFLYNIIDHFPFLLNILSPHLRSSAQETQRYFQNKDNIACDIRELLKIQLRPRLKNTDHILIIAHSMGSIIAYDTLWELAHLEQFPGKVDLLTIGSPLGLKYVKRRLMGSKYTGKKKYPTNIRNWINISAVGDVTSLDRLFTEDFSEMLKLEIIESIEDHCKGIYNYFHNEEGLNCHRSYGYLVNPAVGKVIADWWQHSKLK